MHNANAKLEQKATRKHLSADSILQEQICSWGDAPYKPCLSTLGHPQRDLGDGEWSDAEKYPHARHHVGGNEQTAGEFYKTKRKTTSLFLSPVFALLVGWEAKVEGED